MASLYLGTVKYISKIIINTFILREKHILKRILVTTAEVIKRYLFCAANPAMAGSVTVENRLASSAVIKSRWASIGSDIICGPSGIFAGHSFLQASIEFRSSLMSCWPSLHPNSFLDVNLVVPFEHKILLA